MKQTLTLDGRGHFADQHGEVEIPAAGSARRSFTLRLDDKTPAGRQVFVLRGTYGETTDGSDAFLAVDVQPEWPQPGHLTQLAASNNPAVLSDK